MQIFTQNKYNDCFLYCSRLDSNIEILQKSSLNLSVYRLQNFAKVDITPGQIYLMFFPQIFNKSNKGQFTSSFLWFSKLIVFETFLSCGVAHTNDPVQSVCEILQKIRGTEKEKQQCLKKLKQQIKIWKDEFLKQFEEKKKKTTNQDIRQIERKIQRNILMQSRRNMKEQFLKTNIQTIYEEEIIPFQLFGTKSFQKLNSEARQKLRRYHNFRINNLFKIPIYRKITKKFLLKQFSFEQERFFEARLLGLTTLFEWPTSLDTQINKLIKEKSMQEPEAKELEMRKTIQEGCLNKILMKKLSQERVPILCTLKQYIRKREEIKDVKKVNLKKSDKILIIQLLKLNKYYKDSTKNYYPQISTENVIFDQLKLKFTFSRQHALFQALGLSQRPKTVEMTLAFEPTPQDIDLQKSCQEFNEQNTQLLQQRYFNSQFWRDMSTRDEKTFEAISKLNENINVERVLQICFFVLNNGQYFSRREFIQQYNHSFITQQVYVQVLKENKRQLKKSRSSLKKYFGQSIDTQIQKKQNFFNSPFDYTVKEIEYLFLGSNKDDSLIKGHKFSKVQKELNLRVDIIREVVRNLKNQKYLKKMYNVKKYVLIFHLEVMEQVYQSALLCHIQRKKRGERRQMDIFFKKHSQVRSNEKKIFCHSSYIKIKQYFKRSDYQGNYLKSNVNILNEIEAVFAKMEQMVEIEQKLNPIQNQFAVNGDFDQDKYRTYSEKLMRVEKLSKDCFHISSKTIYQFIQKELNRYRDEFLTQLSKKIFEIAHQKMLILINSFIKLNHCNWTHLQYYLLNDMIFKQVKEEDLKDQTILNRKQYYYVVNDLLQTYDYTKYENLFAPISKMQESQKEPGGQKKNQRKKNNG